MEIGKNGILESDQQMETKIFGFFQKIKEGGDIPTEVDFEVIREKIDQEFDALKGECTRKQLKLSPSWQFKEILQRAYGIWLLEVERIEDEFEKTDQAVAWRCFCTLVKCEALFQKLLTRYEKTKDPLNKTIQLTRRLHAARESEEYKKYIEAIGGIQKLASNLLNALNEALKNFKSELADLKLNSPLNEKIGPIVESKFQAWYRDIFSCAEKVEQTNAKLSKAVEGIHAIETAEFIEIANNDEPFVVEQNKGGLFNSLKESFSNFSISIHKVS